MTNNMNIVNFSALAQAIADINDYRQSKVFNTNDLAKVIAELNELEEKANQGSPITNSDIRAYQNLACYAKVLKAISSHKKYSAAYNAVLECLKGYVVKTLAKQKKGGSFVGRILTNYNNPVAPMLGINAEAVHIHIEKLVGSSVNEIKLQDNNIAKYYGGNVCIANGGKGSWISVSIQQLARHIDILDSAIMLELRKDSNGTYSASEYKEGNLLLRWVTLIQAGIDLSGLRENKDRKAVFMVTRENGKVKVERNKAPILGADALYWADETNSGYSESRSKSIAVAECLRSMGYNACGSDNQNAKHGYVQLEQTLVGNSDSAFMFARNGKMYTTENINRLLTRQEKQVKQEEVQFSTTSVVFATLSYEEIKKLGFATKIKTNTEIARQIGNLCATGQIYMSNNLFARAGCGRYISGFTSTDTGTKAVGVPVSFGNNGTPMLAELSKVAEKIAEDIGQAGNYVVAGLNSTKSTAFKHDTLVSGKWNITSIPVTFADGSVETGYIAYKYVNETLHQTESAVSVAYEKVSETKDWTINGLDKAINSYNKTMGRAKSLTVKEMIFTAEVLNGDKTIVQQVKELLNAGLIKEKAFDFKVNSQVLNSFAWDHAPEVLAKIAKFLVNHPDAKNYRNRMLNALKIQLNELGDTKQVDCVAVARALAQEMYALGIELHTYNGNSIRAELALMLVEKLISGQQGFIHEGTTLMLCFGDVSFPVFLEQNDLESFKKTDRLGYIRFEGIMAEVMKAFAIVINNFHTVEDDTGVVIGDMVNVDYVYDRITQTFENAFNGSYGKNLSRIPARGMYGLLVSSNELGIDEIYAPRLKDLENEAKKAYRTKKLSYVTCKNPATMTGAVRIAISVDLNSNGSFCDEELKVLFGRAIFVNPIQIVANGNDTDGDKAFVMVLPKKLLNGVADKVRPFGTISNIDNSAAKQHWTDTLQKETNMELENKQLKYTEVTGEMLAAQAIVATKAKSDVAIITNLQASFIRHMDKLEGIVKDLIVGNSAISGSIVKHISASVNADQFAKAVVHYIINIVGTLVNLEAMDLIKKLKRGSDVNDDLSALIASVDCRFATMQMNEFYLKQGKTEFTATVQNISKKQHALAKQMVNKMFIKPASEGGLQFSLDGLQGVLKPESFKSNAVADVTSVHYIIAFLFARCSAFMHYFEASTVSPAEALFVEYKGNKKLSSVLEEAKVAGKEIVFENTVNNTIMNCVLEAITSRVMKGVYEDCLDDFDLSF